MRTMTRRAFGRGLGALAAAQALGACTSTSAGASSGNPDLGGVRDYVRSDSPPDLSGVDWEHVSPDPASVEGTVATAAVDPSHRQCLFLWEEGNAPTTTASGGGSSDPADFRPTITTVPAAAGTVRGAVLLCAGGAFSVRGDNSDCYPTAQRLSALGYQCFVVDYRVRPYTQAESGCDLARAIRFVRAHADDYDLPSHDAIALGGYSAGGILCGETILNWSGAVSPTRLDPAYAPDELDAVSADAAATAMIYSFYGRLSVAELNPDELGRHPHVLLLRHRGPLLRPVRGPGRSPGGTRRNRPRPRARRLAARLRRRGRLDRGVRRLPARGPRDRLTAARPSGGGRRPHDQRGTES